MGVLKDYRDPLYGFISVNECEQQLIDSRCFQRLRNINQLGTTFLVYPSAMHTRFEHSLGTLFVMDKMLHGLVSRHREVLGWSDDDAEQYRRLARLAALLHDLGHPPFSHAAEDLLPRKGDKSSRKHEDYTYQLITKTELAGIIDRHYGKNTAVTVAEIAVGKARTRNFAFLSELLTGDFGADRVDYLIRDSFHLGVEYGRFDVHRLLNTLMVRQNEEKNGPDLVLENGGLHTVEGFLLARYFMFLEVYFHKTRRILDLHLVEFLRESLGEGNYPEDPEEYCSWDDHKVWALLSRRCNCLSVRRLLNREHFRLAFETEDHPAPVDLHLFDWLKDRIIKEFGPENIRFDEATKAPYSYSFKRPPIFVAHREEYVWLTNKSTLVQRLQRITKCRVYAAPPLRDKVTSACESFWRERKAARGGIS